MKSLPLKLDTFQDCGNTEISQEDHADNKLFFSSYFALISINDIIRSVNLNKNESQNVNPFNTSYFFYCFYLHNFPDRRFASVPHESQKSVRMKHLSFLLIVITQFVICHLKVIKEHKVDDKIINEISTDNETANVISRSFSRSKRQDGNTYDDLFSTSPDGDEPTDSLDGLDSRMGITTPQQFSSITPTLPVSTTTTTPLMFRPLTTTQAIGSIYF